MNIAFEISPLITASGTFGDKSGVYRYMYGLIISLVDLLKKNDSKAKIVLFTFNKDLLRFPLNQDVIRLINNKNVIFLDKFPKLKYRNLEDFEDTVLFSFPPVFILVKLIDKLIKLRLLYANYLIKKTFQIYLKNLEDKLIKHKVKVIFHSETGFFYLNKFKNVITIYDLTTLSHPEFHRPETIDLQKRKLRFARRFCDGIICISQRTKKDLLNYSPKFSEKAISVIYPGINPSLKYNKYIKQKFNSVKELDSLLNDNNNELIAKKYLLYYGTFEPRKNTFNLVKAFINLHDNNQIPKNYKLVLCGGEGWGNIKFLINTYIRETYPFQKNRPIIVLDYLNDIYLKMLIKNAYAVVYPSLYEGFGLPVLESLSLGTPVICSKNSSLPEVGGYAVLYINPNINWDIEDKLKLLIYKPELAHELSEKGKIQSNKFSWEKSAEKTFKFIQELTYEDRH